MEYVKLKSGITFKTKLKDFEKILFKTAIEFYMDKLSIPKNVNLEVQSIKSKKYFGDLKLNKDTLKNNKFKVSFESDVMYPIALKVLAHELIHIKQVSEKELSVDGKNVIWKNKHFKTIPEFKKANNSKTSHDKMPFEIEANKNMDILYNQFLKSKELDSLKESNQTIKFIFDNL